MEKINATEKNTIKSMIKTGFSFYGDSQFKSFNSAKRCLDGLVRKGYAQKIGNEFKPTQAAFAA